MTVLPPLPPMPSKAKERQTRRDAELKKRGPALGRWQRTRRDDPAGVGRCWRCGKVKAAVKLVLWLPPFAKAGAEVWACKDKCDDQ